MALKTSSLKAVFILINIRALLSYSPEVNMQAGALWTFLVILRVGGCGWGLQEKQLVQPAPQPWQGPNTPCRLSLTTAATNSPSVTSFSVDILQGVSKIKKLKKNSCYIYLSSVTLRNKIDILKVNFWLVLLIPFLSVADS